MSAIIQFKKLYMYILSQRLQDMEGEREDLTDEDPLSEPEGLADNSGWDIVLQPTVFGRQVP